MPLTIHTSNRIEALADALAMTGLTPAPGDPLGCEWILVNSQGMESWLRQQVTERLGITANLRMPFLQSFIDELARRHPDLAAIRRGGKPGDFARTTLHLRILDVLGRVDLEDAELASYLSSESHPMLRRYQLAARLAQLFDRYQIHRPDFLDTWEGDDIVQDWQARLWNVLREGSDEPSLTETLRRLAAEMERVDLSNEGGDLAIERLSLFNVTALPPIYLEVFSALAERIPVNLYTMEVSKRLLDTGTEFQTPRPAAPELSPPLEALRAWALQGRDFIDLLARSTKGCWKRHFVSPLSSTENASGGGTPSMLECLQDLILDLDTRVPDARLPLLPDDRSLVFHSCHGPQREIEVLHDQLLALFEADPTLTPRDVIVMAPEIADYVPYIEASFGYTPHVPSRAVDGEDAPPGEGEGKHLPYIPFSVADRFDIARSQVFQTLVSLMGLASSRFKVNEILDLLAQPLIHRNLAMAEGDLGLVAHWARETAIRWGWDETHRAQLGLPATKDFTWQAGLDRLLAGYAMAPKLDEPNAGLFAGIAPFAEIEGEGAVLMGKVVDFLSRLRELALDLGQERTFPEWRDWISTRVLDPFFGRGDNQNYLEIQRIRSALDELARLAEALQFEEKIPPALIVDHLQESVGASVSGVGFFRGKVTFCSLMPMRSIPARIICLLGMNDGAFPRTDRPLGFDRSAGERRPGDRSRRLEDRYLFLEAILAARSLFYVSYQGRARGDNTGKLPSGLVTELREAMAEIFDLPEAERSAFDGKPLGANEVEHRLQAFNLEYFLETSPALFSYSRNDGLGARAALTPKDPLPLFDPPAAPPMLPPISAEDTSFLRLSPRALSRFFLSPCDFLLRRRLGVDLRPGTVLDLKDDEFARDGLHDHRIRARMLDAVLREDSPESCRAWLVAMGWLSESPRSRSWFEGEWLRVSSFATTPCIPTESELMDLGTALRHEHRSEDIFYRREREGNEAFLPIELDGRVDPIVEGTHLVRSLATMKTSNRLATLIEHLCHCAGGCTVPTTLLGLDERPAQKKEGRPRSYRYESIPTAQAEADLLRLLAFYEDGLRRPLPFETGAFEILYRESRKEGLEAIDRRRREKKVEGRYPEGSPLTVCLGADGPWPHDAFYDLSRFFIERLEDHEKELSP